MCGIYLFNIAWEEAHKHDAPTLFVHLLRQQKPSSVLFKGAKREMITTKNPPLPSTLCSCLTAAQAENTGRGRRAGTGRGFESIRRGFGFSPTVYPRIFLSEAQLLHL